MHFKQYGKIEKLTRPILTELVDSFIVHENGNITIISNSRMLMSRLLNILMKQSKSILKKLHKSFSKIEQR